MVGGVRRDSVKMVGNHFNYFVSYQTFMHSVEVGESGLRFHIYLSDRLLMGLQSAFAFW